MPIKKLSYYLLLSGIFLLNPSCKKDDVTPVHIKELNFSMNCGQDSACYYYTINYERIYLKISTYSLTIKFTDSVSIEYIDSLIEKNTGLDSVSSYETGSRNRLAFGYLNNRLDCNEIESLLISLNKEDKIACANPNFHIMNPDYDGGEFYKDYLLVGCTNEFVAKVRAGVSDKQLQTLLSETNTRLIAEYEIFNLYSADKNSSLNCLEMSRYFYETGYFEYSLPNFLSRIELY
jgi:hypothetical protein